MENIKPGTLFFLVGLVEQPELLGRVVEVISGPDEQGWYFVTADWASEMFQGRDVTVQRRNLRPIGPFACVVAGSPPETVTREQGEAWRLEDEKRMYAELEGQLIAWLSNFTAEELSLFWESFEQNTSFKLIEPGDAGGGSTP